MQVENLLSRRVPVLLDDGDSVGFRGVLNGDGGSLDDIVDVGDEVVGHVVNSLIMLSGNDERMSLVKRSNVEKRNCFFVFVDDAGRSLFFDYSAKDT